MNHLRYLKYLLNIYITNFYRNNIIFFNILALFKVFIIANKNIKDIIKFLFNPFIKIINLMTTTIRYFYITVKRILGFSRIYFLITDIFFFKFN